MTQALYAHMNNKRKKKYTSISEVKMLQTCKQQSLIIPVSLHLLVL
jgi:hypothetical protein